MRTAKLIECYGGPLDGTILLWRDDLPEWGPDYYLRTPRADGTIAAYVSTTRPGRAASTLQPAKPTRPTFVFLGHFSPDEYSALAGRTFCLGLIERVTE